MASRRITAIMCATLLVAVGSISATPAVAAELPAHVTHSEVVANSNYTDKEVLEFLAFGSGPIDSDYPGLINALGYDLPSKSYTDAAVDQLLAGVEKANPSFHAQITKPLQSGNPLRVEAALDAYNASMLKYAKSNASVAQDDGVHTDCVVWAAALAVVLVVVIVSTTNVTYVHNTPHVVTSGTGDQLTKQQAAAAIASTL